MEQQEPRTFTMMQVVGIVVGVMTITVVLTFFVLRSWLFPSPFVPVVLTPKEDKQLELKLNQFSNFDNSSHDAQDTPGRKEQTPSGSPPGSALQPEAYSEAGASRDIYLSERELNAIIAKNTDLATKLAVDLSDDLISAKMIIPIDPDFPMLGGKTLKVKAGVELAYRENRPMIKLRGVSVMGVPVPNAWMGGLKNIDLVQEFGDEEGFWKAFSDGVESIEIVEGTLEITLKE